MARPPTVGHPGHRSTCAVYPVKVQLITVLYCQQTFPTESTATNQESCDMLYTDRIYKLQMLLTGTHLSTYRCAPTTPLFTWYLEGRFPIFIYFLIVCNHSMPHFGTYGLGF